MNNEKMQGSKRQWRAMNQIFNCNKMWKESCCAHCHTCTWECPIEELSRSLFWDEHQGSAGHKELNYGFVQIDSAFAHSVGAALPRSGCFHWQQAKGKPRENGIHDQSLLWCRAQGQLQECKLHPSKAWGKSVCEATQLYISSQQRLYLKVWAKFLLFLCSILCSPSLCSLFLTICLCSLLLPSQWISRSCESFHISY